MPPGVQAGAMTEWRAVGVGFAAGTAYLAVLAFLPGLRALRWSAVALVLGTGLVAGAAAGLAAGGGPDAPSTPAAVREGGWHGLLAGSLSGGLFAAAFVGALRMNTHLGVFFGLNYLLATSAGRFPVVATHGELVVAALAGLGWSVIAALGLYAGLRAPERETNAVVEE